MNTICLSNLSPVAKGDHRACYPYPSEADKCIKILYEDWRQINRRTKDPFRRLRSKTHFHENLIEFNELRKIERKCGERMRAHFPKTYGFIQTDLGDGLVTDFYRDADGRPAHTLKSYLWEHGYTASCKEAINQFWEFLFEEAIIVRDPDPYNICIREAADGSLQAYLVDGYGRSDFLPFVEWFPSRARRKLGKRKSRFERQLHEHLEQIQRGLPMSGKGFVNR